VANALELAPTTHEAKPASGADKRAPVPGIGGGPRVTAIDLMRGIVMVLMSIDHASEVFNAGRFFGDSAMFFTPGTPIPPAQFMTRWISHLCAPTFVTLAGTALAISTESRLAKGQSARSLDQHILVRGLLLLALEVCWMSWGFMAEWGRFLLQVLYGLGASLVCMVLLRRLSDRTLLVLGIALAFGSELIIGFIAGVGALDKLPVALVIAGGVFYDRKLIIGYPFLPWLAMMCIGWAFGRQLVRWRREGKDESRLGSRSLAIAGVIGLLVFFVLRGINGFGNMRLLREGGDVLQWLHVSKYPPSATYVGLELGIAALALAALMRLGSHVPRVLAPVRLFGQTALFYYLLHVHVLDLVAWISGCRGKLGIASAYIGALGVLVVLYPACAWYRRYKSAHPDGWARWI
jgi:uncharacterized membrane protein